MVKLSLIFLGVFSLYNAYECSESSNAFPANQLSVAFYNVDNLYDTIDDPKTFDDEFTPFGKNKWSSYKYAQKL